MGLTLAGRRVLLTGASGGIGAAIARAAHGRGAELVISGRRADVLEAVRGELGDRAEVVVADLADPGAAGELVDRAGPVDVLIANAALPSSGGFDSFSAEQIDRSIDVNLRAPIHLARLLAPSMAERRSGHLVFISSMSGKVSSAGSSIYSATKFGLRGFAFGLREDLRRTGVGVTTVFPGFISDAGMFADTGVSLPRFAGRRRPDDVADAVVQAIERNSAEVDVAPLPMRVGAAVAGVAPGVVTRLQQRLGADTIAARVGRAQRVKR